LENSFTTDALFPGLTNLKSRDPSSGRRLVVVCVAHSWNPCSVSAATYLETLRSNEMVNFAQVYLIDGQENPEALWEFGFVLTLSICTQLHSIFNSIGIAIRVRGSPCVLLYFDGKPMTIRRKDWMDDVKCTFDTSNLFLIGNWFPVDFC
jgi:hypothetical protein